MIQKNDELMLDLHAGEFEAFLYSPSNQFLGIIRNEISLLSFQCKVRAANKRGYYIIYDGKRYPINEDGRITPGLPIHYLYNYLEFIVGF